MFLPRTTLAGALALAMLAALTAWGPHSRSAPALADTPTMAVAPFALAMPTLQIEYLAPRLILRGVVPSEAERQAIVRRAGAIYGTAQVTDRLEVGPVAHPSWFDAGFLPDLRATERATALLADGQLDVQGKVSTARARDALAAELARHRSQGLPVRAAEWPPRGP